MAHKIVMKNSPVGYFVTKQVNTLWSAEFHEADDVVKTRDGRSVRILCTDRKSEYTQPVIGLVADADGGEEQLRTWCDNGLTEQDRTCKHDLFVEQGAMLTHKAVCLATKEDKNVIFQVEPHLYENTVQQEVAVRLTATMRSCPVPTLDINISQQELKRLIDKLKHFDELLTKFKEI